MNNSKITETLSLLRGVWKEGQEILNNMSYSDDSNFEYHKWNTKAENYLKRLFYKQEFFNEFHEISIYDDNPNAPVNYVILKDTLAAKLGYIESNGQLLKQGYIKDQGIGIDSSSSESVFIAMWFAEEQKDIFIQGIKPAVEENNYTAFRIDQYEHNDKIDEKILDKIREARFLIADYTGHRGGVYFEAGFAKGLGLQVIPLCQVDHKEDLHFDVMMYNTILYKDIPDLKRKLEKRIKETMGVYIETISTQNTESIEGVPF